MVEVRSGRGSLVINDAFIAEPIVDYGMGGGTRLLRTAGVVRQDEPRAAPPSIDQLTDLR